jgi:hypothetical protein
MRRIRVARYLLFSFNRWKALVQGSQATTVRLPPPNNVGRIHALTLGGVANARDCFHDMHHGHAGLDNRMNNQKRTAPMAAAPATRLSAAPLIPHNLMKTTALRMAIGAATALAIRSN